MFRVLLNFFCELYLLVDKLDSDAFISDEEFNVIEDNLKTIFNDLLSCLKLFLLCQKSERDFKEVSDE